MKIETWNVERLKHFKKIDKMLAECKNSGADILVLTETDERLRPDYLYCYSTPLLKELRPGYYKSTENRVSIFANYKCVKAYPTYDKFTAICVELETEEGNLLVYGTIMGKYGNRDKSFNLDLSKQMEDIKKPCKAGHNVCIMGDYNLTFSDNYYFTRFGRESVLQSFKDDRISLLTKDRSECIDHIVISDSFMHGLNIVSIDEWNYEKELSDHKGIVVEIKKKE